MELLVTFLLGAAIALSPTGLIGETKTAKALRSRLGEPEALVVRLESYPAHKLPLAGRIDRLRLASRNLQPFPWLPLEALEIETGAVAVDLKGLQAGEGRVALRQPLQVAWHATIREADLNQALAAPANLARLQPLAEGLRQRLPGTRGQDYEVLTAAVDFQNDNRLAIDLRVRVRRASNPEDYRDFQLQAAARVTLEEGQRLQLQDLEIVVDGNPVSDRFTRILQARLSDRLDLGQLEDRAILARLLQLKSGSDYLELTGFVRLEQTPPANATL